MPVPSFIHLRMHSEYSIVNSTVRIADVLEAAKDDQQGALALTDYANLFGAIKFYRAARQAGIKPLLGCDIMLSSHIASSSERSSLYNGSVGDEVKGRCLLLIKNLQGYLNLCSLISRTYLNKSQKNENEIKFSWFFEQAENIATENNFLKKKEKIFLSDGLILLSGAHDGAIGEAILKGRLNVAKQIIEEYKKVFTNNFYLEIQRSTSKISEDREWLGGIPSFAQNEWLIGETIRLAKELQIPVVATHPIQFMNREDFTSHEARVCIANAEKLANAKRKRCYNPEQYFRKQSEMVLLFTDLPETLQNSVEIAKRCNLELPLGKIYLPDFPIPTDQSIEEFFTSESHRGLENRLIDLFPKSSERTNRSPNYWKRLNYEIDIITQMGFAGYFLIVADFVSWSIKNDVPVGPGRGSGAGSLVAFALGITNLDPLRYNLLFERFLNPERVSMPDFDIDFCQHGRDSVIGYVKQKYGQHAVAQIATFGTMAAKAAIRDIGRVLDLGYGFTDSVARLIPFKPGRQITIQSSIEEEPLLLERYTNEEEVKNLLDLAKRVEGLTRNVGMHAGGVLIADGPITRYCPVYKQDEETGIISQYDKDDVEAVGLVKFDFLGLTTLTILHWAEKFIRKNYSERCNWSKNEITLDDPNVFRLLKSGKTVAVFQLESRGMQGMLKDAQPDRFEDIIALVALFRPGPMDLIPSFCARKQGREKVSYPDARVADILSETYGIMVYQEQVMQMAQIIGGYSLGSADLLRRAMGKKKPEEMAQHRALFRKGAISRGLTEKKADEIFDLMEKFAGYGFNKSHAASYALLAYYTAWMKVHYPAEFMAANLSLAVDDSDKVKILIEESKALGLAVAPPDINRSSYYFLPEASQRNGRSDTIRFGLGAIKGTGQNAITVIEKKKSEKDFMDLFDFCLRCEGTVINKRTLEALIKAGAFDSLEKNRAALLASMPLAFEVAAQAKLHEGQESLFLEEDNAPNKKLIETKVWSNQFKLQEEKAILGFYFSGHPFDSYVEEISKFSSIVKLVELQTNRQVTTAGIISQIRIQAVARGKLAIVTIDDASARCDVVISQDLYDANRALLQEDNLLIISGQAREDSFSGGIRLIATQIMDFTNARISFAKMVRIKISKDANIEKLKNILLAYKVELHSKNLEELITQPTHNPSAHSFFKRKKAKKEGLQIEFFYENDIAKVTVYAGPKWVIIPDQKLFNAIENELNGIFTEVIY